MTVVCPRCKVELELPDDMRVNGVRVTCDNCSTRLAYQNGKLVEEGRSFPARVPLPQNHKEDTQCTSADSNTGWALCFAIAAACVTVGGCFNSATQGYVIFNALVFALLGLSFGRWPHDFKSGSHKVEKLIIVIITVVSILHLVFYAFLRELARH